MAIRGPHPIQKAALEGFSFRCGSSPLLALGVTLLAGLGISGCGGVASLFGEDERNVSAIADYGTNSSAQPKANIDPELEAFWERVAELSRALPPDQAGRLQVNLRDLRIRVDRPTAELVLVCGQRLLDSEDLKPYIEEGSLELALMLEQFAGDELMRQLRLFAAAGVDTFQGFLDTSKTVKPADSLSEQLRRGQETLDSMTASPEILPKSGNYASLPLIRLGSPTEGARIYYSLDNSEPNESSTLYTEPFVTPDKKEFVIVKAIAFAEGLLPSAVNVSTYTITLPKVARPTASVSPGRFKTPVTVSFTSTSSNAEVRYTLDGSTPTLESPLATGGVLLGTEGATTLKARGFASQMIESDVSVGTYTVDLHPPVIPETPGVTLQSSQSTGFTASWNLASDNLSASADLRYIVVVGASSNQIDTTDKALAVTTLCGTGVLPCRSTLLPSFLGISYAVRGLTPSSTYSYTIIAQDEAGHSSGYGIFGATTTAN